MCITLHFSGWNLKSHVCDQDINLFRSSCRPKESFLVLTRHQILVSSANILMLLMIQVGKSIKSDDITLNYNDDITIFKMSSGRRLEF